MAPRVVYEQCEDEDSQLRHGPSAECTIGTPTKYRPPARQAPMATAVAPGSRMKFMCGSTLALTALVGAVAYMRGGSGSLRMRMETMLLSEGDNPVPAFKQCGGKGVVERVCESGCLCTDASNGGYFKMCAPPDGHTSCNVEAAKEGLAKLKDEIKPAKAKLQEADKAFKSAKQAASKAWDQEKRTKTALQEANQTLDSAQTSSRAKQEALAAKIQDELKEAKELLATVTKKAEAESARKNKEVDEKLKETERKLKEVSDVQVEIQNQARKERDDTIEAARTRLQEAEDKLVHTKAEASMDRQDVVNAARKKAKETKQAQEDTLSKTKEALTAKMEAEQAYDELEEQAGAVEHDMHRYTAARSGVGFDSYQDDDDADDFYD